jgi:hypothetical protein
MTNVEHTKYLSKLVNSTPNAVLTIIRGPPTQDHTFIPLPDFRKESGHRDGPVGFIVRIATDLEVSLKLIGAAPKARNVIAQGNALGQHADLCLSAESAK